MAQFIQEGNAIDYIPVADVPSGTVVEFGNLFGIINGADISPADKVTAIQIEGVIEGPAVGVSFVDGGPVGYDTTGQTFEPGTGFLMIEDTGRVDDASNPIIRAKLNR